MTPTTPYARKYPDEDVALLVAMDRAHEDVSGPAIAHLLLRAYHLFANSRYDRLADLSVSPLYNLGHRSACQASGEAAH